jgi:hypothetical protein
MLSDTHMAVPSLVLLSLCYTARAAAPTTHHGVSEYEPGAGWETLTLTGTQQRVDSNRTIPANTSLRFVDGGGFFVEAGATLTIEGDLTGAPLQQIFAGPGAIRFAAGAVERVLPQWFGCKANGKMDCTVPVQKAIDSIWATNNGMIGQTDGQNGQGGGEIYFPTGIYPVKGITGGSFMTFRGANQKSSIISTCFNCGDPKFPASAPAGPCACVGDKVQSPGQIPGTCNCTAALALHEGKFSSWAEADTNGPDGFQLDRIAVVNSGPPTEANGIQAFGYTRELSLTNFYVSGYMIGVFVPWGLALQFTSGYIECMGCNTPTAIARLAKGDNPNWCDPYANGTIALKVGDGAQWNASCDPSTTPCNPYDITGAATTITIIDVYFVNMQTGLYIVGGPFTLIRPMFEDGEVGIRSWGHGQPRATLSLDTTIGRHCLSFLSRDLLPFTYTLILMSY